MRNKNIRTLFNDTLKAALKQSDGKLLFPLYQDGMIMDSTSLPTRSHIVTHLMPSPSFSLTLAGREHTCYNGLFRMYLRGFSEDVGYKDVDTMTELIANTFYTDLMLKDASGFEVQVIAPLNASEAKVSKEGSSWWEVTCYLEYRSDVYTPIPKP